MNEIWLVYSVDYVDIEDVISYTTSEENANKLIEKYENMCKEDYKIDVANGIYDSYIHKPISFYTLTPKQNEENRKASQEYLQSIPFEVRLKYMYGNSKFEKRKIERGEV